jgi:hypothetical protein
MRILVDLGSHVTGTPVVTQVEKVPLPGEGTPVNGKYLLPIYPSGEFEVTSTDYVLDGAGQCDGGDLSSKSFAYLLMQYPMFEYIYFNPLLTADHVAELDLTATFLETNAPAPWGPSPPFPPIVFPTRVMTGRPLGLQAGTMPTHTCILPQNNSLDPARAPRPGMLITQNIDISTYTGPAGTDEFMVYWKLYSFTDSADINDEVTSVNEPTIRRVYETDDEPTGLSVYISIDDGGHWSEVNYLTPVAFTAKTTAFRLAFKNTSTDRVYLACFAVLF